MAADALEQGLNFTAIGNAMQRALHLHKEVEAVKIIFITDPKVLITPVCRKGSKNQADHGDHRSYVKRCQYGLWFLWLTGDLRRG